MAGLLYQHVLGLEIAICDVHTMEILESAYDFGDVEANDGGREYPVVLTVTEGVQVAAGTIGNCPSQKLVGFEDAEEGWEEGVVEAGKDGYLPTSPSFCV